MLTGIQLSSLKPYLTDETGLQMTLKRIKEMGCDHLQIQWIDPAVDDSVTTSLLRQNGLKSWGLQDFYEAVTATLDRQIAFVNNTQGRYLCFSGVPKSYMESDKGIELFIQDTAALAEQLAGNGMIMTFHPRMQEYALWKGTTITDRLMAEIPQLQLTLDCYHAVLANQNIPAMTERYIGRMDMIHVKNSVRPEKGAQLTTADQGCIDYKPILKAAKDNGVLIAFAEQETWPGNGFDEMKHSFDWIRDTIEKL